MTVTVRYGLRQRFLAPGSNRPEWFALLINPEETPSVVSLPGEIWPEDVDELGS